MGRFDCVEIACEMEVDIDSRLDSRFATAGTAALVTEYWPKRWLPNGEDRFLADFGETLGESIL